MWSRCYEAGGSLLDEPRCLPPAAVFREEDQTFFFGREPDVKKLVTAVSDYPVVAIVGASGSGKSSVARAGSCGFVSRLTSITGSARQSKYHVIHATA